MAPANDDLVTLVTLVSWWSRLAPLVAEETRGLWFGMVDLDVDDAAKRHLYVAGCPTFDPDDEGDWACEYCWWPDERYVLLPSLAAFPDVQHGIALQAAVDLVRTLDPTRSVPQVEGVGVGFDDGDFEIVWSVD